MIYGGDLMSNFSGSMMSKDMKMTKDVILSELHRKIDKTPEQVISVLNNSGVKTKATVSKKELIKLTVDNMYDNPTFRNNISQLITSGSVKGFNNADGDTTNKAGEAINKIGSGGASGGAVGAVAGAIDSIFGFAKAKTEKKAQKEADKQALIQSLLKSDTQKKSNLLPIIIITSVLLIGGFVAVIALKDKK